MLQRHKRLKDGNFQRKRGEGNSGRAVESSTSKKHNALNVMKLLGEKKKVKRAMQLSGKHLGWETPLLLPSSAVHSTWLWAKPLSSLENTL